ncbi:hypothetical protein EMMF5_005450 [Cystobasidiomycetes sp. EMM_F5]
MPFCRLPKPVQYAVLEHLSTSDLYNLSLVCAQLRAVAQAELHRHVALGRSDEGRRVTLDVQGRKPSPKPFEPFDRRFEQYLDDKISLLVRTLRARPDLAACVQHLQLGEHSRLSHLELDDLAILLRLCTRLYTLKMFEMVIFPGDYEDISSMRAACRQVEAYMSDDNWTRLIPSTRLQHLLLNGTNAWITSYRAFHLKPFITDHLLLRDLGKWPSSESVAEFCSAFRPPRRLTLDQCQLYAADLSIILKFGKDVLVEIAIFFGEGDPWEDTNTTYESDRADIRNQGIPRQAFTCIQRLTTDNLVALNQYFAFPEVKNIHLFNADSLTLDLVLSLISGSDCSMKNIAGIELIGGRGVDMATDRFITSLLLLQRHCAADGIQMQPPAATVVKRCRTLLSEKLAAE